MLQCPATAGEHSDDIFFLLFVYSSQRLHVGGSAELLEVAWVGKIGNDRLTTGLACEYDMESRL